MSSIDPLVTVTAWIAADPLVTSIASIAAVILSVFCALLAWGQHRRLAAMQTRVDNLTSTTRSLESDYERLFLRSLRSRKARKSSNLSSDAFEEKMTAPTLPDEKKSIASALQVGAPKYPPNKSNG
jgi:hypothetical protein